jgi:hypothetical protein
MKSIFTKFSSFLRYQLQEFHTHNIILMMIMGNNYGYEYYYDDYNYPTNIIMNILMIIIPMIYIEDIIMITGMQLSASILDRFFVEFRLSPYQIRRDKNFELTFL